MTWIGQPGRYNRDRTTKAGQPGQDSRDWFTWICQSGQVSQTGQSGQVSLDRTHEKEQPELDIPDNLKFVLN
jgi:hypothetical protein